MHIPEGTTDQLELLTFQQALEAANTPSEEYELCFPTRVLHRSTNLRHHSIHHLRRSLSISRIQRKHRFLRLWATLKIEKAQALPL